MVKKTATIGERIREARESQGISQVKLAKAVGITRGGMSNIELDRNDPSLSTVRAICEFLELSFDILPLGGKKRQKV